MVNSLKDPKNAVASIGGEIKTELINAKIQIDSTLNYLAKTMPGANKFPAMRAHNEIMMINSRLNSVLFNIIKSFPKPPSNIRQLRLPNF